MDELDLAPRKKMLTTLSDDLVYEGWDLDNKLWMILGSYDDPYLEYVGSYGMEPAHWFMHRAEEGVLKEHIIGIVTCWEAWVYNTALSEHLQSHAEGSPEAARAVSAFQAIIGPESHPERKSCRTIVSAWRDGQAVRVEHYEDRDEKLVTSLDDPPTTGPTGQRLVDHMRSLLDINEHHLNPLHGLSEALNTDAFKTLMEQAQKESWPNARLMAEIYKHAPEQLQQQMRTTMPEDVRRLVDGDASNSD